MNGEYLESGVTSGFDRAQQELKGILRIFHGLRIFIALEVKQRTVIDCHVSLLIALICNL